MQEFKKAFKDLDRDLIDSKIKIPEIIFIANKSEDGYEGDLLGDFYKMFPHISEPNAEGKYVEPIFISAEHGDGL